MTSPIIPLESEKPLSGQNTFFRVFPSFGDFDSKANFGIFKLSFLKISVRVIPTTINCCLILPTNPQYFSSLIFKYVATNLSFEYAWFFSNFGLNLSKFRIRQSSNHWVEKSQVTLLIFIVSI